MNKNTLLIGFVAGIALVAGLSVQRLSANKQVEPNVSVIAFSLPDMTGKLRNINEWQGKIRIINFWATWCPPCLKEIPEFIKLQNAHKKDLQFIGIAIDEKQAVEEYLKTININYPMLISDDEGTALSHQFGNVFNAVPFTLIVNKQGQIIHRQAGELSNKKIIEIITPLVRNSQ